MVGEQAEADKPATHGEGGVEHVVDAHCVTTAAGGHRFSRQG